MSKRTSSSAPAGEPSSKVAKHDQKEDLVPDPDGEVNEAARTPTHTVTVVGMKYRNRKRDGPPHRFSKDKTYTLLREPTNEFDPNAIKLMCHDDHVAYVCREDAKKWAPRLDEGA